VLHHFQTRFGTTDHVLVAYAHPNDGGDRTLPSGHVADVPPIEARVNGGWWIADCPFADCAGAELVNLETGLFFCCGCRNAAVDHAYVRVRTPDAGARALIERQLAKRPHARHRHWHPGETIADLKRQDAEAKAAGLPGSEQLRT
jgi:hypothetical protein